MQLPHSLSPKLTVQNLVCLTQLLLDKMTDAMKADVQKKLDDTPPGNATADRFTRQVAAARAARPAAAPSGAAEGTEGAAVEEAEAEEETTGTGAMMDTYELAEPVEIFSKLDKAHGENPPFWSGIKDAKWSLRRDALKELQVRELPDFFASRDGIDTGAASGVCFGSFHWWRYHGLLHAAWCHEPSDMQLLVMLTLRWTSGQVEGCLQSHSLTHFDRTSHQRVVELLRLACSVP